MVLSDLREKSALVPVKQRAPQPARPSPQFTHPVEILVQAPMAGARRTLKEPCQRVDAARQQAPSARRSSRPSGARRMRQPTSTGWAATSCYKHNGDLLLGLRGGWGDCFRFARLSTAATINKTVHFSSISVYMGQGGSGPA